ncbi:hypothetical protein MPEAHAMD_7249 [Methylobacterium frigidaeris]|uniref:Uncharacterized protein n=1 Tax=Methylobacterium frigidaeris TaxID=2038277 RepID=A0AA37M9B5_9HYPH|nr:hypothetical protein MPEAHAMD_7249 [Methylobacterium frigidaeris]
MTKLTWLVLPAVGVAKSAVPPMTGGTAEGFGCVKALVPVSEVEPTTWAAVAGFVTVEPVALS